MAKKWLQKKEPCLQSKERSLHVWFVSFRLRLSQIHTTTVSSLIFASAASFPTANVPSSAAFSQATHWAAPLQQLSGNPPLGYVWGGGPPRWAGCDCRCHECAAVTCAEKRQRVWRCLVAFEDSEPQLLRDPAGPVGTLPAVIWVTFVMQLWVLLTPQPLVLT